MSRRSVPFLIAITVFGFLLTAVVPAFAQPDLTLYTEYTLDAAHTNVNWVVCGSTQQTSGCYAMGTLGPFGKVGALLEGNQSANLTTNTVTRLIYVLDVASGNTLDGVKLYVYKKADAVSPTFDTVTVSLVKTVSLPITGGTSALASMAANNKFLFIGTDQSPTALRVQKGSYALAPIGGFQPPTNVSAITADKYGYVIVTFGGLAGPNNSIVIMGPNGNALGDGGGSAPFTLNTVQAVLPSELP